MAKTPKETRPLDRVMLPDGSVDWETFQDIVRDSPNFLVYDPPQKKRSFFAVSELNFFTPRSPYGVGFPCCLAETLRAVYRGPMGHDFEDVKISKPDEWFLKMMEPPPEGNNCPEFLRGVLWMQDNIANETVMPFDAAHWGSPDGPMTGVGIKSVFKNWSKGSSLWGTLLAKQHDGMWGVFQVSPDWKWINLGPDNWIYILQPGDRLVDVEGKAMAFTPGDDFLRVTWKDRDPKKGLHYQYLLRRVARKDEKGQLQKVQPAFDTLMDRATRPTVQGVCCNLFLCNISDADYGSAYDSLDDHQIVVTGSEDPPWIPDGEKKLPMELNDSLPLSV